MKLTANMISALRSVTGSGVITDTRPVVRRALVVRGLAVYSYDPSNGTTEFRITYKGQDAVIEWEVNQ